jgi:hypothetical protein
VLLKLAAEHLVVVVVVVKMAASTVAMAAPVVDRALEIVIQDKLH